MAGAAGRDGGVQGLPQGGGDVCSETEEAPGKIGQGDHARCRNGKGLGVRTSLAFLFSGKKTRSHREAGGGGVGKEGLKRGRGQMTCDLMRPARMLLTSTGNLWRVLIKECIQSIF